MVSYKRVKRFLDEWGEAILYMDSGVKYEIHGDVDFDDSEQAIQFNTGSSVYVIDGTAVEAIEAHRSHQMGAA